MPTPQAMTAETATIFTHGHSAAHVALLAQEASARGCNCQAYRDWFTYRRWQAQGCQIRKGEHGTKITTWVHYTRKDKDGQEHDRSRPKGTTVFCRCQVDPAAN